MSDGIILGSNQYGKAEVHLVKVTRDGQQHSIEDVTITSQLRGDFTDAHIKGDNAHVVATDTQKNTIFAFARDGIGSPEAFMLRLADHFTSSFDWVSGGRWAAESQGWARIQAHGAAHDHSFVQTGPEKRTAIVVADGRERHVLGGLRDLTVLKTTESGFEGFPRDRYTTLAETDDRILATEVAARWRYASTDIDFNGVYESVRALLLEAFTENYSAALQATLFDMGKRRARSAPGDRGDPVLDAEQAPLRRGPQPVRPRQPQRGLLRRRPPLRPHRGDRSA